MDGVAGKVNGVTHSCVLTAKGGRRSSIHPSLPSVQQLTHGAAFLLITVRS